MKTKNASLLIIYLILNFNLIAQESSSDDGRVWNTFYFVDSKFKYLSSLLERLKLQNKLGIDNNLPCNIFLTEKYSEKYSLEKVIEIIDNYYGNNKNVKTPIIYAYCYSILKLKGVESEGLEAYSEYLIRKFNK